MGSPAGLNGIDQLLSLAHVVTRDRDPKINLKITSGTIGLATNVVVWIEKAPGDERNCELQVQRTTGPCDVPQPQDRITPDVEVFMSGQAETNSLCPRLITVRSIHADHDRNVKQFARISTSDDAFDVGLSPTC